MLNKEIKFKLNLIFSEFSLENEKLVCLNDWNFDSIENKYFIEYELKENNIYTKYNFYVSENMEHWFSKII